MHGNEAGKGGELTHDETTIITGALDLTQKTARDAMTPISETFSLDINSKLDLHTMGLIMTRGHSRVPIYSGSPSNIIGLILVKNLIVFRPEDKTPIQNLTIRNIPRVNDCSPLYQILNEFQEGNSHMAVVVKCAGDVKTTPKINVKSKTPISKTKMHRKESKSRKKGTKSQLVQSGVVEPPSAVVGNLKEEHNMLEMVKKLVQGGGNNVLDIGSDYQASYSADEEVIGIITMEDVIEELLQDQDKHVTGTNIITRSPAPFSCSPTERNCISSCFISWHTTAVTNSLMCAITSSWSYFNWVSQKSFPLLTQ
ncbi:hypothetical protein Sjap_020985 [Stephania japonica]|uniref:CBS domain-containing protein n=1 Tax=Stephania japonica TaxID=461633 RepID=A0AAP0F1R4_9MAGN